MLPPRQLQRGAVVRARGAPAVQAVLALRAEQVVRQLGRLVQQQLLVAEGRLLERRHLRIARSGLSGLSGDGSKFMTGCASSFWYRRVVDWEPDSCTWRALGCQTLESLTAFGRLLKPHYLYSTLTCLRPCRGVLGRRQTGIEALFRVEYMPWAHTLTVCLRVHLISYSPYVYIVSSSHRFL